MSALTEITDAEKNGKPLILPLGKMLQLLHFLIFIIVEGSKETLSDMEIRLLENRWPTWNHYCFNARWTWNFLAEHLENDKDVLKHGRLVEYLRERIKQCHAIGTDSFDVLTFLADDKDLLRLSFQDPACARECIIKVSRVFAQTDIKELDRQLLEKLLPAGEHTLGYHS